MDISTVLDDVINLIQEQQQQQQLCNPSETLSSINELVYRFFFIAFYLCSFIS